ncbi:MAG: rhomboid family intramembrane serine protease [Candidatus Competibacteraceae bacterium]|nr:rhomboid family intramembrane serine protease [Candidatus Competibacteraceae bacterium]
MQFSKPDPAYTNSARARLNFRLAFQLALGFVLLLGIIHLLDGLFGLDLARFGLRPRQLDGLWGILWAPLLHGSTGHLISNSLPLIVLLTGLLYLYPNAALKVFGVVYFGTGIVVWLGARPSIHIGASGLVYGLAVYIFTAGLIRRDARAIAASMLVYFLYGTLVWGVFPTQPGISWETHLAAALIGLLLAIYFRQYDQPPLKRYSWEDEEEDDTDQF